MKHSCGVVAIPVGILVSDGDSPYEVNLGLPRDFPKGTGGFLSGVGFIVLEIQVFEKNTFQTRHGFLAALTCPLSPQLGDSFCRPYGLGPQIISARSFSTQV